MKCKQKKKDGETKAISGCEIADFFALVISLETVPEYQEGTQKQTQPADSFLK